jgi:hypothetical protein
MTNPLFKQTLFISFIGHIAIFSIFGFTFGPRISETNFMNVSFGGAILRISDLVTTSNLNERYKKITLTKKSEALVLDKINRESFLEFGDYLKPMIAPALNKDKIIFAPKLIFRLSMPKREEPTIMFYPKMPYHFALYFKDRQIAHIELMFAIDSIGERNSIVIKRKISSGSLELDLLSMRYIGHYLFIQQAAFIPRHWQTVKIDLSTFND